MKARSILLIGIVMAAGVVISILLFWPPGGETWTWPIVGAEPDNTWIEIISRVHYKEAFVVTEEDNFMWLKLEVRVNGERVGEGPSAGVRVNDKFPSLGVHDIKPGDRIYIENIGRMLKNYDVIEVLYENNVEKSYRI